MATERLQSAVEISLSREELLFVLDVLQTQFLPGLDEDPEGSLSKAEQVIALRTARRALQARELLRVRLNGDYALHNSLLRVVGICAYPQDTVFVYHWAPEARTPVRTFIHVRGNDGVIHERPDTAMHRFSLVSADDIAAGVLDACALQPREEAADLDLSVPNQAFMQARQFATSGQADSAIRLLNDSGMAQQDAEFLVESLAGTAAISILQVVKRDGESLHKRDITIVQNGIHNWMVQPLTSEKDSPLSIRTLHVDLLREVL